MFLGSRLQQLDEGHRQAGHNTRANTCSDAGHAGWANAETPAATTLVELVASRPRLLPLAAKLEALGFDAALTATLSITELERALPGATMAECKSKAGSF